MYMWGKVELVGPFRPPPYTICPSSAGLSSALWLSHCRRPVCLFSINYISFFFISANSCGLFPETLLSPCGWAASWCFSHLSSSCFLTPPRPVKPLRELKLQDMKPVWLGDREVSLPLWGVEVTKLIGSVHPNPPKHIFLSPPLYWCVPKFIVPSYQSMIFLPKWTKPVF